jgi:hypothetical protein
MNAGFLICEPVVRHACYKDGQEIDRALRDLAQDAQS